MYFPVLSILPNIGFLDLLQRIMTIHLLNARGQINEVFTEEKNSKLPQSLNWERFLPLPTRPLRNEI